MKSHQITFNHVARNEKPSDPSSFSALNKTWTSSFDIRISLSLALPAPTLLLLLRAWLSRREHGWTTDAPQSPQEWIRDNWIYCYVMLCYVMSSDVVLCYDVWIGGCCIADNNNDNDNWHHLSVHDERRRKEEGRNCLFELLKNRSI